MHRRRLDLIRIPYGTGKELRTLTAQSISERIQFLRQFFAVRGKPEFFASFTWHNLARRITYYFYNSFFSAGYQILCSQVPLQRPLLNS